MAVDARDGRVAVDGWTRSASTTPRELAERCAASASPGSSSPRRGATGCSAGPDLALLEDVLGAGLPVIAAGGICSLADLRALRELGCEGAVVGSAIWRGRVELADAVSLEA